jgi:ADP-heptose:LPS heptosyltransferase
LKVSFMQTVDYWAGVPLCLALSTWHGLVSRLRPRPAKTPKNILFIELSEMGSAIIAYSALAKAKADFVGSQVYFLIFKRNRESVDLLGLIPPENVLVIEDRSLLGFLLSMPLVLLKIWRRKIDTAIDMELFSRCTALISYLSGASNRVGFDNYLSEGLYRGSFLTHRVLYNHHQHMSFNFLALLYALKAPPGELPLLKRNVKPELLPLPRYRVSESQKDAMRARLFESNPKIAPGARLIVINPDPGLLPLRGWPRERFAQLAAGIVRARPDTAIVMVGLERSKAYARLLAEALPANSFVDMSGRTRDLAELLVSLSLSSALITNDSGPAHMASLTGTPVFVIFGPETPALYAPLGPNVHSLFANFSCSPCYAATNHRRTICRDNKCLQAISVDEVLAQVLEAIPR